jgi:hypothetical protein
MYGANLRYGFGSFGSGYHENRILVILSAYLNYHFIFSFRLCYLGQVVSPKDLQWQEYNPQIESRLCQFGLRVEPNATQSNKAERLELFHCVRLERHFIEVRTLTTTGKDSGTFSI